MGFRMDYSPYLEVWATPYVPPPPMGLKTSFGA